MLPFDKLVKNIQKLSDHDPILMNKIRKYIYEMIVACIDVHKGMGPYLNEYMYQEALDISLEEHGFKDDNKVREYYFAVDYHGKKIPHRHYVDFFVNRKVFIECKAIGHLGSEQRQQLWNYMRLTGVRIGILYNFAPFRDECEKYYYDPDSQILYAF